MKKRWLKRTLTVMASIALLMILVPRLWVKNSRAHLVVDGRVTDDFRLYFGPWGRLLVRIGDKTARKIFVYSGTYTDGWADECPPSEFFFPPFVALSRHVPPRCTPGEPYRALASGNKLTIQSSDGHTYEVTWQPPPR